VKNNTDTTTVKRTAGRKPLEDKKILVRVFVKKSIVEANGGIEAAQIKCAKYLADEAV
jgi:hypothetical protein